MRGDRCAVCKREATVPWPRAAVPTPGCWLSPPDCLQDVPGAFFSLVTFSHVLPSPPTSLTHAGDLGGNEGPVFSDHMGTAEADPERLAYNSLCLKDG